MTVDIIEVCIFNYKVTIFNYIFHYLRTALALAVRGLGLLLARGGAALAGRGLGSGVISLRGVRQEPCRGLQLEVSRGLQLFRGLQLEVFRGLQLVLCIGLATGCRGGGMVGGGGDTGGLRILLITSILRERRLP